MLVDKIDFSCNYRPIADLLKLNKSCPISLTFGISPIYRCTCRAYLSKMLESFSHKYFHIHCKFEEKASLTILLPQFLIGGNLQLNEGP